MLLLEVARDGLRERFPEGAAAAAWRARLGTVRDRLRSCLRGDLAAPPVASHGWALLERVDEAVVELELAWALGGGDRRAVEAHDRARVGLQEEARALLRATTFLSDLSS